MLNPFERLRPLPSVDSFVESEAKRLGSIGGKTVKEREIRRLKDYRDRIEVYVNFVRAFPRVDELHPFYKTSLEIASGSLDRVKMCLSAISRHANMAQRMLEKYMVMIKREPEEKANSLMRAGFGRASSILRRMNECVEWISGVVTVVSKGKAIDPELPTVMVAGPPNVGKSTLVSKISSARPEIANYPFTTKEIHVGHMDCGVKVQVIDTPGILDRPDAERNVIERKAVNALRNLNGLIVFLFDVSTSSIYGADEQLNIMREVKSLGKPVILAMNKIDAVDENMRREILSRVGDKVLEISSEQGTGIPELKREIFNWLKSISQDPSAVLDC
ncbi:MULTISPECIES: NOG1 family protein [Metallosphaera]|uniref:Small GTP-binding protein n=3 Tax=Metallosphaera TaxID=41980 RepID=A4YI63_METS5|nr:MULTISPECIES: GTPase [Metallosphaera]ABP96115.1 small GTP-binding protein [Metallosphaera sedula DSM 5348]AIM28098.1 small GTP-binding protein [Metallosphaera sedula]AKV74924.1 GTP-binding protein [Metallosphaera sedula]AKV77162.1 GTP-binding protein [Metallosphaera sedula]AKV79412.1 GTP-binding protein [Metallosphaera sedula]